MIGFVVLTGLEWENDATLGGESVAGKLLGGFFAAVTARSAGFNTVDYADMGTDSLFVTDLLMFVGGGERLAGRRDQGDDLRGPVPDRVGRAAQRARGGGIRAGHPGRDAPAGASPIAVIALNAVVLATLVLVASNDLELSSALFECVSAFSTTGLSTGVTGSLDTLGQAILMVLMFLGRVGPITLGVALVVRERERLFSHPEERPIVG